jgi:hypothetical protein
MYVSGTIRMKIVIVGRSRKSTSEIKCTLEVARPNLFWPNNPTGAGMSRPNAISILLCHVCAILQPFLSVHWLHFSESRADVTVSANTNKKILVGFFVIHSQYLEWRHRIPATSNYRRITAGKYERYWLSASFGISQSRENSQNGMGKGETCIISRKDSKYFCRPWNTMYVKKIEWEIHILR